MGKLWIAHGLSGLGGSVRNSWIEVYELAPRETPKNYVVRVRGQEKLISKGRLGFDVFVDYDAMIAALQKRKAAELAKAERAVAQLSQPIQVETRIVSPDHPPAGIPPTDLQL